MNLRVRNVTCWSDMTKTVDDGQDNSTMINLSALSELPNDPNDVVGAARG